MLGTIVNSLAIIIGGIIGLLLKKGIKDDYKDILLNGLSLVIIILGIMDAIKSVNPLLLIISIVLGSIFGQWIDIESMLENIGNSIQSRIKNENSFSKGFVTASLIYCIGAMAIIGSLESGLTGNHVKLFVKSYLDGITSIIFTSTLGIGVIFSSISVFIYQGIITLSAIFVKDLLTDKVIVEMTAIGGLLIIGIGINILGFKKIKVANMLPAIFVPIIYFNLLIPLFKIIQEFF